MLNKIRSSPLLARVIPFAAFAALTLFQGRFGDTSQYWIYALKTIIGAWLIWQVRPCVPEMRWNFSWEAIAAGIFVFVAWVGLDGFYPMLSQRSEAFNPIRTYGAGSILAVAFVGARLIGSSLVVPMLEEIFYRSFLYRYLIQSDFSQIRLGHFSWKAFLMTGIIFGIGHYEWLPGILCAFVYQGLVCRKARLGDAITAHAITNFLLGLWVIFRPAYQFW
jgi:uncharacterized protein